VGGDLAQRAVLGLVTEHHRALHGQQVHDATRDQLGDALLLQRAGQLATQARLHLGHVAAALRLPVEAGVLDGDRGLGHEHLHDVGGVGGEADRLCVAEREHGQELVAGHHRVGHEAAEAPPPPPLEVDDPCVVAHVGNDQPLARARHPADAATVLVGDGSLREIAGDLGHRAAHEGQRGGGLVGQPEGYEANAGELGRRLRDGAEQDIQLERAGDALVDRGQRPHALGLHALRLVQPGVADGHAGLGRQQPQGLLLLGVGQPLGQDVVQHAHECVAHVDRDTVVGGARSPRPPRGSQRARMLQRLRDEHRSMLLDDEAG
jgi:hypothetical protein